MSAHLTEKILERFRRRTLSPEELLAADEHLFACEGCRRKLAATAQVRDMLSTLREGLRLDAADEAHLAYEQFAAYVDGELRGGEREAAEMHMAACRACAEEARELFELKESLTTARANVQQGVAVETHAAPLKKAVEAKRASSATRGGLRVTLAAFVDRYFNFSPQWAAAAAAVLLLASLSVWWLVSASRRNSSNEVARQSSSTSQTQATSQSQTTSQSPIATPAASPAPSNQNAPDVRAEPEHVDSQRQPTPRATPKRNEGAAQSVEPEEIASLPASYREPVRKALRSGQLIDPDALAELRSERQTLLGDGHAEESFALEGPAGVVARADRPVFRWRPLRDAEGYTVKVFDADFRLVASSPQLTSTEWTPATPLARGRVYGWQVIAKRGGVDIVAPAPPAPEAHFKVLSRAEDETLTRAERDTPRSHLALGVLYARAGLIEDAEREFNAQLRANPRSDAARKLLRALSTSRRQR